MRTKAASFAASVMCFTGFDQCWNLQGILDVAIHLSLPSISPEYRKKNERKEKKKKERVKTKINLYYIKKIRTCRHVKLFQIPKHNYDGRQTTEHSFRLAYKSEQLHCRAAALAAPVERSCHLVVPARQRKLPKAHQPAQLAPS